MAVQTYLFFNGRCEEALEFYKTTLGAEVDGMMRFSDNPEPPSPDCPPMSPNSVMHASFRIGGTALMASDGMGSTPDFRGFSLSLDAKDEAEAQRLFDALGQGGTVQMPLGKTFWSPCFGMVTDQFGVAWMVGVNH